MSGVRVPRRAEADVYNTPLLLAALTYSAYEVPYRPTTRLRWIRETEVGRTEDSRNVLNAIALPMNNIIVQQTYYDARITSRRSGSWHLPFFSIDPHIAIVLPGRS